MLYQLSYSRVSELETEHLELAAATNDFLIDFVSRPGHLGHGGEGNRTPDLLNAIQALSQLSYAPDTPKAELAVASASLRNRQV